MTRRALVLSALAADFATDRYNAFAVAYNTYVNQRERGVMDLKALERMREAWRRLEKSAGWPVEKSCRD